MRPEPFAEVEILHDDAKQHLRAGQRGYLLDWLSDPQGGEDGALIELHEQSDRADPTVTVPESWVRAISELAQKAEREPRKRVG